MVTKHLFPNYKPVISRKNHNNNAICATIQYLFFIYTTPSNSDLSISLNYPYELLLLQLLLFYSLNFFLYKLQEIVFHTNFIS